VNRTFLGVVLATCLGALLDARAYAQPAPAAAAPTSSTSSAAPTKPSEAPLPSCLDETLASELGAQLHPRGVQKRNFLKRKHLALVVHGGLYGGDLTSSDWIAGGSLGYFFTEDFGIYGEFDMTPLTLDQDSPLTKFFGDNRFTPGMAYVALGNAVWSPIHAKMKMGGGIVHADILLFAGGGRMFHDAVQGLSFDAGAAIDFFVSRAMTVRLELRDLTAVEEVAASSRMTNNLIATAGLAFWIPL